MDVPLLAAAAALVLASALTHLLIRHRAGPLALLDHPNERSLHAQPVARTGGIAVLVATLLAGGAGLLLLQRQPLPPPLPWLTAAVLLVAAISYLDDRRHVPVRWRLTVHLLAALLLWFGGLRWSALDLPGFSLPLGPLAPVLTLFYVIWMINLYNFMDGMDGLAGSMAVFGFGALAVLGQAGGEPAFTLLAASIAAAAAGFLTGNFPPARIFLGDLGASTLGLAAAALILWGNALGLFPLWVGWLAFSPFIVDATWTLLARLWRHERVWEAHRSHHYQRLVLAGWGHRRTLLRALLLMAATAATAVAAPRLATPEQSLLLLGWGAIYGLIHVRVGLAERITASTGHERG
ncbi:MAG: glycosyltransferase family 4 protein [Chromatiaceae bacterium]|nr:MAG: glycosyltransferase family 4 protein [Chromatiaceae bacterium]